MRARELFQMAEAHGWTHSRTNGSHHIYTKSGHQVSIPGSANREVKPGTVASIVKKIKAV